MKGISTAEAKRQLLRLLDTGQASIPVPPHFDRHSRLVYVVVGSALGIMAALVVNGTYLITQDQKRGIASVVEVGLLALSILFTWWVVDRESALETHEVDKRLLAIAQELRGWGGGYADLRTPQMPTVTTYTVLRDGEWRDVPTLLLVEGDIIALAYGEMVPCAIALCGSHEGENRLERGQKLAPSMMREWTATADSDAWDPRVAGHSGMAGRVLFAALATPLQSHLELIAQHHRRTGRSVLQNQMRVVIRILVLRVLPGVVAAALVANVIIYGVVNRGGGMGVEAVLGKTAYVVFPFACAVMWPVFWIAARIFTSASGVVLFDALQRSKTEYEDMDDIDEFDVEALPPTKDVRVGIGAVLGHMRWLWSSCDHRNLSRSSNLAETLGNITVICSIDKEGTIAEPFCTPEQIVVPKRDDYALLDLAEQQLGFIIDEGWEHYLPGLRPLGLDCGLNTAAHANARARIDSTHRRHNRMRCHGKALPAQDTCLCQIGRGIGFTTADLAQYRQLKEVDVFAPFHQATDSQVRLGVFGAASFTSAVVQAGDSVQMLTDGNVELVLGMCLDYFDGTEIRALDDRTMAMYYGLYLNALQQDLQCLAFAYRPLSVAAGCAQWPGTSSVYVDLHLDMEVTSTMSSDGSDGALASSPSVGSKSSRGGSFEESVDLPEHLTQAVRHALLQAKPRFAGGDEDLDDGDCDVDYSQAAMARFTTEEDFLRDVVSEQILLGLVTFSYEPKTDVCDFIEDLDIAGIRFVYFSRSRGRQSKSFAERLGLETDWNTCILLSSADGTQDGGYVEDHDIKARLPRGIENIRPHLREVDDIPLQVSLFAECTPESTREMIKVFQENGDVVCCMGSALKDSNTLTFAVADLAVGVEPIPHFNRVKPAHGEAAETANDGSISTAGALVTQYALGAALTCIPCPLFLQHDTSLYTLMQVVSEARRLLGSMQQAAVLLVAAALATALINLAAALCLLPPALPGFMQLWLLWAVVPLLAATLLFVPRDESIMSTMPLKNHAHVSDLSRFATYALVRSVPPVALTVLVYVTALARLLPDAPPLGRLSSTFGRRDWRVLTPDAQWALLAAQTYAMVAFAFHCVCVSATLMHRTRTTAEFLPVRNVAWVCGALVSLALTCAFGALLLAFGDAHLDRVGWYTYAIAFAGPVVLLPVQDLCKLHDKKRWTRLQKLAKLEFKTKLGLHSPL